MCILRKTERVRPGGGGWGGEHACAKDAAGDFGRRSITNVTAEIRIAGGRCDVGKPPNGNASVGPNRKGDSGTRRPNAGDGQRVLPQASHADATGSPPRRRSSPARGHAAEGSRRFFATVRGATKRRLSSRMHAIATRPARRPCVKLRIASASGSDATPKRASSSVGRSINRRGCDAAKVARWRAVPKRTPQGPLARPVRSSFLDQGPSLR